MSIPAFYLPREKWGQKCVLTGDEARHARALRLEPGEDAMLLDGEGQSAVCVTVSLSKREVVLEMRRQWAEPEPASRAIMAIALSKAIRRGFFLEKAAELGAWGIWFWQAERSQGDLTGKLVENCAGQIRAGAKQCRNPWFPQTRQLGGVHSLAEAAGSASWRLLPWEEEAAMPAISLAQLGRPGDSVYVIGPEGGLTKAEVDTLKSARFTTVSLGRRVLRCETAATLCLGLHYWASQLPTAENMA